MNTNFVVVFDVERVGILGCQQKHMAGIVPESMLVDLLNAGAIQNVDQFKKVVLMRWFGTFIQLFVDYFKGLVQVFFHGCYECTVFWKNYTAK